MAIKQWLGSARAVRQVSTITIGGTPAPGDTFTVSSGLSSVTYTVGTTADVDTIAAGLRDLLNGLDATSELRDAAWLASVGGVLTATGSTAGQPFTLSVAKTGTGTITLATPTAATGPNHADNPVNWSGGSLPVAGDIVIFSGATSVFYGLTAAGTFAELQIRHDYTGQIGLPATNSRGYREYRPRNLAWPASLVLIGGGGRGGRGSSSIRIDLGSIAAEVIVLDTGRVAAGSYAVYFIGQASTMLVEAGSVGLALDPVETAELTGLLTVGGSASVSIGPAVTLSSVSTRGNVASESDCISLSVAGGVCAWSAAAPQIDVFGGILQYQSDEAITHASVGPGTLDCSDLRPRTCGTLNLRSGGRINDPWRTLTVTTLAIANGVQSYSAA